MNNFIRYYNQNRKMIFVVICIIIFFFVVIQLINNFYKQNDNSEEVENTTSSNSIQKDYTNESESLVQGTINSDKKKKEFGELVDNFLGYCINGQVSEAYSLLSNNCKDLLYPTEKKFEKDYYSEKFMTKKNYDFQLWSAVDETYIYLVRIFDDMLSTGRVSNQNYIQDYLSVVQEDNVYRLNIGGYLRTKIFKSKDENGEDEGNFKEVDNIRIMVKSMDAYMDYEVYHLAISNYSQNDILLSDINNNTVYIVDENGNNINSMIYEFNEEDLKVVKGETKNIDIKFSRSYSTELDASRICFDGIIKDYDKFLDLGDEYQDITRISIEI